LLGEIEMKTNEVLKIKDLLDIIYKTTNKNSNILAGMYLLKDVSIISKWKNNKVSPKTEDISKIVEFAIAESSEAQRRMMRDNIKELILNSSLKEEIKKLILNIVDFEKFLTEVLNISTCSNNEKIQLDDRIGSFKTKAIRDNEDGNSDIKESGVGHSLISDLVGNIEGKYSGIVEFDMVLYKNEKSKNKNSKSESTAQFSGSADFSNVKRAGRLQKYLKGKTILGLFVLGFISIFLITQMSNISQNTDSKSISEKIVRAPKDNSVSESNPESTPQVSKDLSTKSDEKATKNAINTVSDIKTPTVTPKPTVEPIDASKIQDTKTDEYQKQPKKGNENSSTIKNKTIDNKTTNNTSNIQGDGNVVVQGNNNAVSIN
jgi:cytoskeletal protein RodZ